MELYNTFLESQVSIALIILVLPVAAVLRFSYYLSIR